MRGNRKTKGSRTEKEEGKRDKNSNENKHTIRGERIIDVITMSIVLVK